MLLLDLVLRARFLSAHYSDAGVVPRALIHAHYLEPGDFSLHLLSGSAVGQAGLFLAQGLCAVLLLGGIRPRLMAALSFVLLASLQTRNPMVVGGGDNLLRVMLFWSIFLPLGPRDHDAQEQEQSSTHASLASVAYVLQLSAMYWFSLALKRGPAWRSDLSALADALAFEHYTTGLGAALREAPVGLLAAMTLAVLVLEACGPLLAMSPFRRDACRLIAVASMLAFHLGIAATMRLGLFPWICMIMWIPLLPDGLAERGLAAVGERRRAAEQLLELRPPPREPGRPLQVALALLLLYVLAWNIRTLDYARHQRWFPDGASVLGRALHLGQNWRLFTPEPPSDRGWFVVPVELRDGRSFDYMTRASVSWTKPARISALYPDHRWRKYFLNFRQAEHAAFRPAFAEHVCRLDPSFARVSVIYVLDADTVSERSSLMLLDQACPD